MEHWKFNNPKGTATAVILKDNKVLLLKRNEEPFKGMWDFPGGYMNEMETSKQAVLREVREELGVEGEATLIGEFPGYGHWKEDKFPIISHAYLVEIFGEIKLNGENSEHAWIPLKEVQEVAFDSNMDIIKFIKDKFTFDLDRVRALVAQLDASAEIKEYNLYKAILGGYLSTIYDGEVLVGMGWSFARQTLLRKQAVVEDMIVDESQRGKGFGYKILDKVVKLAADNGTEVMELTTNPKRERANKLYADYGFWLHPTNHYLFNINK